MLYKTWLLTYVSYCGLDICLTVWYSVYRYITLILCITVKYIEMTVYQFSDGQIIFLKWTKELRCDRFVLGSQVVGTDICGRY